MDNVFGAPVFMKVRLQHRCEDPGNNRLWSIVLAPKKSAVKASSAEQEGITTLLDSFGHVWTPRFIGGPLFRSVLGTLFFQTFLQTPSFAAITCMNFP